MVGTPTAWAKSIFATERESTILIFPSPYFNLSLISEAAIVDVFLIKKAAMVKTFSIMTVQKAYHFTKIVLHCIFF